jgi:hypothetical protein
VSDQWIHGRSTYLKYKCRCDICVQDARQYRETYIPPGIRLKPEPLIQRLTSDGRTSPITNRQLNKWLRIGLDLYTADRWAVKLGYHPYEIWGDDFYQGCEDYVQG